MTTLTVINTTKANEHERIALAFWLKKNNIDPAWVAKDHDISVNGSGIAYFEIRHLGIQVSTRVVSLGTELLSDPAINQCAPTPLPKLRASIIKTFDTEKP